MATEARVKLHSRVRDLFLHYDFIVGASVGVPLALLPALVPAVREGGGAYLLTLAAVDAAIATLVLMPMTVLVGMLSEAFRAILRQTSDGVAGVVIPFAQAATVAGVGAGLSLVAAALSPLADGTYWWCVWIGGALPLLFTFWALTAVVDVTRFMIRTLRQSAQADELEQRREAALSRRAG